MTSSERVVVTVDDEGRPVGTCDLTAAHQGAGVLHSAISLQVIDSDSQWLVQRRRVDKPTFGGRWANSCCTHPLPDENPADATRRRAFEELGLRLRAVEPAGSFVYRAVDESTGYVEHELDRVFVGRVDAGELLVPHPAEIAEARWVTAEEAERLAGTPDAAPWFARVVQLVTTYERSRRVGLDDSDD